MSDIETEFEEFDKTATWGEIYQRFRNEASISHDFTFTDARRPEYRDRNRYRDVSPYDHSRVKLDRDDIDYINSSLIEADEANRKYILTQGPLPNTSGHFWLMVWEQNSKAVLMLNRVIEKGTLKCHQYFPTGVDRDGLDELEFPEVDLKVRFIQEQDSNYYTVRTLELEDTRNGNKKEVQQFHYVKWPDFGVPQSPAAFLNFLLAVRKSGALESNVGPPIIHCSAGIGRSGTFCLVDTCLVLIEKHRNMNCINVRHILMEMRKYRMGLIQTADQLRFSYQAIIEGGHAILNHSNGLDLLLQMNGNGDTEIYDNDEDDEDTEQMTQKLIQHHRPPPLPPRLNQRKENPTSHNETATRLEKSGMGIRRRDRDERKRQTEERIEKMKKKLQDSDKWQQRNKKIKPLYIGLSVAILVGGYFIYRYYF